MSASSLPLPIKGVLCDIGGVLYVGDAPIEGAVEAINQIKKKVSHSLFNQYDTKNLFTGRKKITSIWL